MADDAKIPTPPKEDSEKTDESVGVIPSIEKEEVETKKSALKDQDTGKPLLKKVKIYSPFKVYFDNDAFSVSAVNGTGPFDVLPGHKNFLSLLKPCEVVIQGRAGEEKLEIERGIMHVRDDSVAIFLDV